MTRAAPQCPHCGGRLTKVQDRDEQTPPWLCNACHRGWWHAELNCGAWDQQTESYPAHLADRVLTMIDVERGVER